MTRLRLKQASGWFAAGREVALALETLSAQAFRLYLYLCLYAERQTGQILWNPDDIAHLFQCGSEQVRAAMAELCRQEVCAPVGDAAVRSAIAFGRTKNWRWWNPKQTRRVISNRSVRYCSDPPACEPVSALPINGWQPTFIAAA